MSKKRMVDFETMVTVQLDANRIGRVLAGLNSAEQAAFFDGLSEGFQEFAGSDGDGNQMIWIGDRLSQKAKDFIIKFALYIGDEKEKKGGLDLEPEDKENDND